MPLEESIVKMEPIFSDIDPNFRIDAQGNIVILKDEDAVNGSLENLLGTMRGERVMYIDQGCDLGIMLAEPINTTTASFMRMVIAATLEEEPRMKYDAIYVEPHPDDNEYLIEIPYSLNATYIKALFEKLLSLG